MLVYPVGVSYESAARLLPPLLLPPATISLSPPLLNRLCRSQEVASRRCRTCSCRRPALFIPSSQPLATISLSSSTIAAATSFQPHPPRPLLHPCTATNSLPPAAPPHRSSLSLLGHRPTHAQPLIPCSNNCSRSQSPRRPLLLPSTSSYTSSPWPTVAANRRPRCCLPHLAAATTAASPHCCLSRYRSRFYPLPRPTRATLLLWPLAASDRSNRSRATTSQQSQQAALSSASPSALLLLPLPASLHPSPLSLQPLLSQPLPTAPFAAAAPCCPCCTSLPPLLALLAPYPVATTTAAPLHRPASSSSSVTNHSHYHQQQPPQPRASPSSFSLFHQQLQQPTAKVFLTER
ncbi:hypothetical protein BHM03_00008471 [Ensete ventricosum]|nr:hypothetical protein BHM03_00008471 [Ensete ventricosum]